LSTVSVIIPAGEKDLEAAKALEASLKGALEVLIETHGRITDARNAGGRKSKGENLLFVAADVELPAGLDISTLPSYGFDVAVPYIRADPDDAIMETIQRSLAAMGHPLGCCGEFMFVRRAAFQDLGGFREASPGTPMEDTDFAARAWWRGWKLGVFPFEVVHKRRWTPEHYGIPPSVWGPLIGSV
jgi:hypothetical protein